VAEALARAGAREPVVERAEPSLEDVFLAVVGRAGRAAEATP
jgi:ABC-2 type transport system ATP-binding protein